MCVWPLIAVLWRPESSPAAVWLVLACAVILVLLVLLVSGRRRVHKDVADISQYRSIAQASGDVFFKVDPACEKITWGADVGSSMLGYEPGYVDIQPPTFEKWIENADLTSVRKAWSCLRAGERIDLDFRLLKANGKSCWVHLLVIPGAQGEEDAGAAIGVLRRTQDLHDIQAELAEARRLQTIGTMASGIAHEFNNHLTPIRGFIELALDTLGMTHSVSEGLQTALNRVEYCAELVAQIQAYGRKSLLLPEAVQLQRLLPSVVRIAMSTNRERAQRVHLEEEYPEELPELWVDQSQFQQAIVQLILNALEAMPDGGRLRVKAESVLVDTRHLIGHRDIQAGAYLCVSIIDTGEGISSENLEHIFDPFFTTHKRADKRGMGLPMVQGMVAQHGGWLEIRSDVGKGTEVRVFLPQKRKGKREEPAPAMDADGTMAVLPAAPLGRMLIGDDEDLIRSLIRKVFESEGWEVEEAGNFDAVLQTVRNGSARFDLMVLDLAMSGPPAEEVVKEVKEKRPGTNILIISGFGRDERVEKLLKLTGGDFVSKPFSPKILLSKVDAIVAEEDEG